MSESAALAAESARLSLKRSRLLFDCGRADAIFVPTVTVHSERAKSRYSQKVNHTSNATATVARETKLSSSALVVSTVNDDNDDDDDDDDERNHSSKHPRSTTTSISSTASALALLKQPSTQPSATENENRIIVRSSQGAASSIPTPVWHAPWTLATVLSSHLGWVRSIAIDYENRLFATGSADRTIKIWNFPKASVGSSDALQLTLTGHISAVRGLAFSPRHPYLFSCAEDKKVLCWDLETNQVVRHYHGHLSGVYSLALHPTLDLLITGGRDAVARVWDMRTKTAVHTLSGHTNTVGSILAHATHPQIVTGSYDSTIKLWDLVAGKTMTTLTHHNKSVRTMVSAASLKMDNTFVSGAADAIRKWQAKDGRYLQKMTGHQGIVNAMALNEDGVLVSGGDNGSMHFWDYATGHNFQTTQAQAQPGSLEAENGIMALAFDRTGTRLITGETDKTIKIWKQKEDASELTHPVDMVAWRKKCLAEAKERY